MMLANAFFARDSVTVARQLLGKVLRVKYRNIWLSAQIIETEAYYLKEKASHASLGFTEKRKALFMPPGTIYMYHSRGGDSLNVSARGKGNAVLIKAAFPYLEGRNSELILKVMRKLNPAKNITQPRPVEKLCSGQALLCKSLGLQRDIWNQQNFDSEKFYIDDVGYKPKEIIQTTRLGIPRGRDEHLPYRFIDAKYSRYSSKGKC